MNYQKIYKKLIAKRQKYVLEENYEKHHIIPRTIGGDDLESNLVKLTPREHYIAHLLLTKIHPKEDGLKIAWQLMACTRDNFSKVKFSSKMYKKLKLEVRKAQSSFMIGTTKDKESWILLKSEKIFDKSYDSFKSSFRENNLKKYSDLFIVDLI